KIAATPVANRIAVMPFANLSPDKKDALFASGIYDGVSTRLARLSNLRVLSHNSVAKYHPVRDTREIGRGLNVAYVVEGSVRREADTVHLNVQLLDTKMNTHVWAQDYEVDLNGVYALQSEVAQKVADYATR